MFGIGAGEFIMIAIVLLLAVGPKAMPKFMAAVGKGLREFRKATHELRQQTGIDELMRDEQWRDPLGLRSPAGSKSTRQQRTRLTHTDRQREYPREGVDLRHARLREPEEEEADEDQHGERPAAVEEEAN